ncbi:DoxX family protein [Nonomuraea sp. NPDC050310]|uniref:DoxX family protein n=1 Tax=unclassified Nonomuraea TaxID=2593643 RepID=UPI0033EFFF11
MKQAFYDLAALVARLGVGGIFFANGWRKLEDGLRLTSQKFAAQGAPLPDAWATITMMAELLGGALLIAGLVVSVTGLVLFVEALGVFLLARPLNPVDINEIILLGAAAILLAVVGAGRVSVDHMVVIRRRQSEAEAEFEADRDADRVIHSLRDPDEPRRPALEEDPGELRAEQPSLDDTAPHPVPERTPDPEQPPAGDTLVAGRRKPSGRPRKTES